MGGPHAEHRIKALPLQVSLLDILDLIATPMVHAGVGGRGIGRRNGCRVDVEAHAFTAAPLHQLPQEGPGAAPDIKGAVPRAKRHHLDETRRPLGA